MTYHQEDYLSLWPGDPKTLRYESYRPPVEDDYKRWRDMGVERLALSPRGSWPGSFMDPMPKYLPNLKRLRFNCFGADTAIDISMVSSMSMLEWFSMDTYRNHKPVDFTKLKHLREVRLSLCPGFTSIFDCDWLETAVFCRFAKPLQSGLVQLKNLTLLQLFSCQPETFSKIHQLSKLRTLMVYRCGGVQQLDHFAELSNLEVLELEAINGFQDAIPHLPRENLRRLMLFDRDPVRHVELLFEFPKLKEVVLRKVEGVNPREFLQELQRRGFKRGFIQNCSATF